MGESVKTLQTLHFYFDQEHLCHDNRLHVHIIADLDSATGLIRFSGRVLTPQEWKSRATFNAIQLQEGILVSCMLGPKNGIAHLLKADWRLLMEFICRRNFAGIEAQAFENMVDAGSALIEWSAFPEALATALQNYYVRLLKFSSY